MRYIFIIIFDRKQISHIIYAHSELRENEHEWVYTLFDFLFLEKKKSKTCLQRKLITFF